MGGEWLKRGSGPLEHLRQQTEPESPGDATIRAGAQRIGRPWSYPRYESVVSRGACESWCGMVASAACLCSSRQASRGARRRSSVERLRWCPTREGHRRRWVLEVRGQKSLRADEDVVDIRLHRGSSSRISFFPIQRRMYFHVRVTANKGSSNNGPCTSGDPHGLPAPLALETETPAHAYRSVP